MSLPKSWTTVTPLSKMVALILFITLPFITFYLGLQFNPYIKTVDVSNNPSPTINNVPEVSPSEILNPTSEVDLQSSPTLQSRDSCLEGNTVRRPVKLCSDNPVCDKLGPYEDRFCRLPDGTCKFFCDGK